MNEVKFLPLEQCCVILDNKRKPIAKTKRIKGQFPYYGANGIQDYVSDYIFDGKFVLVGEDGSVITPNGKPVVNWAEGKIWVNNHAHVIAEKDGVLLRYLFHYIQTIDIIKLVHGAIPKFTGGDFRALLIPVPPLEAQEKIVKFLDNFSAATDELIKNLARELELRKKQYSYYRDKLITVRGEGLGVRLGDVAEYSKNRINASEVDENSYIGVDNLLQDRQGKIKSSHVPAQGTLIKFTARDILIGNIRPYLKKIWFSDCTGGTNGDVLAIHVTNKELNPKFLFHCLSSDNFFHYDTQHSKNGKMPRGDKSAVMDYEIPLPPLETQEKIVKILDKFEAYCNDLVHGLPAEISARRKQYEYYRDKLLNFGEKNNL